MRFSIVFDYNGAILAASADVTEANEPAPGPGVNSSYFDIPDDLLDSELQDAVECALIDLDVKKRRVARKEADDGPL
jgi:hypothetical protein